MVQTIRLFFIIIIQIFRLFLRMNKDDQIYVQFGDYIELYVEHLQGTVASCGFSNRNVYLQISPPKYTECFSRNKRDFVYQIWPRLNFDARKDYESAMEFFIKNFGERPDAVTDDAPA